ncbi:MAG: C40 family peptidase [Gammaproteobacteria bacterium]|nr:C40 family peptidase [Gammaproteobacteria bacterium]
MGLIGAPYRYGGTSPATGFDCSGLIHYVYREAAGIDLPRTTAGLSALRTDRPPADALQPGDLLLFKVKGGRKVNHAGIYVGDGRFVHAPSSGGRVRLDRLDDRYWLRGYTGARRVLN